MTQQSRQTPLLLASMVLGALAASKSPDAANALILGGQAVAAQSQLNFSRDMEREADRVGYGVMTQAGYSGQGFVSMFEKLQQASRINDNGSFPYLRSHPLTTQRIADMQQRHQLQAPTPASTAPDLAHAMLAARARVLANRAGDVERLWLAEPATPGFAAQEASRRAAALYAAALISLRQREFERARGYLARLDPVLQGQPAAQRQARLLAAELELAAGAPLRAQALLAGDPASAAAAGGAGKLRRPELLLKTQAQLAQGPRGTVEGAGGSMADALQTWLATHPKDATAWQLLAAVYRLEQQPLRAIRAEAEAQVALRDYAAAMDRFRAGQDLARHSTAAADHVEASIIDTRARDVQSILREQAAER
jgi:predicted Zn-dependent protease